MVKQPVTVKGITRWHDASTVNAVPQGRKPIVLRQEIGDVLRDIRQRQGRTLREVSHNAHVSLGYLSEVERGQKEASSDLLAAICVALDVPLSTMLREVSDQVALAEGIIPDSRSLPKEVSGQYTKDYLRAVTKQMKPRKGEYITAA